MTYNVFSGTLNLTQSIKHGSIHSIQYNVSLVKGKRIEEVFMTKKGHEDSGTKKGYHFFLSRLPHIFLQSL